MDANNERMEQAKKDVSYRSSGTEILVVAKRLVG
jgi:hypothetical protein